MADFIGWGGGVTACVKVRARSRGIARGRMRGAVSALQLVVIVVVIALIAAAAWWYLGRSGGVLAPLTTDSTAESSGLSATLAPEVVTADLDVNQLYKEARAAMSDNRMVAPAGRNALEYYLRILAKQPDDSDASDALRELFPFATASAEDQINQGNFDEANRVVALLAKADPSNYALTILRSKLEAKKRQSDRDLALQAQKDAAAAAAATRPQTATAAATAPAADPSAPAPAAVQPKLVEIANTEPAPVAPAPAPVAAPAGETREARVLVPPSPTYPPEAVRSRKNGWVEVEFTVAADGSVQNARVTASEPPRLFDREALNAVQRARFEPRLEKGVSVPSMLRRRIEFKLN